MKMRTTIALIFCALSLVAPVRPQQPQAQQSAAPATLPPLAPPRPGYDFPQKLTLTYSVDWRVFTAGTAVVHFETDGPNEHLTATADTVGAINLLFHVSDHFQSIFDRSRGCTYEFNKQTVEGRRQVNASLKVDYAQSKSTLDEKNVVTGQTRHVKPPFPAASPICLPASSTPPHRIFKSASPSSFRWSMLTALFPSP